MNYSAYVLLGLDPCASPKEIMNKCKEYISKWQQQNIEHEMRKHMPPEQSAVCASQVFNHGVEYLRAIATMLLDPSARQCYDAWLDVNKNYTPEKAALTRARLTWFNSNSNEFNVRFSQNMIDGLQGVDIMKPPLAPKRRRLTVKPVCRQCKNEFSFDKDYLVLHCDCTTRVGHPECLNAFSKTVNHKCPVCRKRLLIRHKVSKYLFWNVKEKFKFVA